MKQTSPTQNILMRILTLSTLYGSVVFCADGINYFYDEIKKYGFIYYSTPLEHAGTGTLVAGGPKNMAVIANPESCFPSSINGVPTDFRFRDNTVIPDKHKNVAIDVMASAKAFDYLSMASPSIRGVFKDSQVQRISIEFNGVHVDYLDEIKLVNFYRTQMPEICKDYLNRVPFIIEAISADQLRFNFYDKNNGSVLVDARKIKEILDISANAQWSIENSQTLVIESPKFLGYQLGSLLEKDNGLSLLRATSVKDGKWLFKPIQVFEANQTEAESLGVGPSTPTFDVDPSLFALPLDQIPPLSSGAKFPKASSRRSPGASTP